jgi:hypothetical protein
MSLQALRDPFLNGKRRIIVALMAVVLLAVRVITAIA